MKTIMKYELVINEALRSALNYHTPDEQINEFIRFFGRHISSDRIYIFEDCKERHVTNNTYEWCAQGVVPEIDRLQNVDMDIIKWWYDTFSKGESIIIADIEDIKEEHRMSYDMLKAQNVRNVVVCPLRYKDEISGFFGGFFRNYPLLLLYPMYLNFASSNCLPHLPYIVRFIIFNLLLVPSTNPLL